MNEENENVSFGSEEDPSVEVSGADEVPETIRPEATADDAPYILASLRTTAVEVERELHKHPDIVRHGLDNVLGAIAQVESAFATTGHLTREAEDPANEGV